MDTVSRFNVGMRTSARQDWRTPDALYATLDREFAFTLDAAADAENTRTAAHRSRTDDGLLASWAGERVWLNPPYRDCRLWVRKARQEAERGAVVVCLIPARCDTAWWIEDVVPHATEVRFIRGRLRFKGALNSAPFPSCVVVFATGGPPLLFTITPDGMPYHAPITTAPLFAKVETS
jgi:site-specific DNA-methyltransferase (adenine-specific)